MVAHFGGKGPGRRVRNARNGIATPISKGRRSDLYVVTGVRFQVCACHDGGGIASNAYLRASHINRIYYCIVIRATNHNIACALYDVFIELHY